MKKYVLLPITVLYCLSLQAQTSYRPIEFIENKGQWDAPFLYKAKTGSSSVFLETNGFTYVVGAPENAAIQHPDHSPANQQHILKFHAYKVTFEGARVPDNINGSKPQQHYYNYFLGNDKSRWKSGIHPVQVVDYKNIYEGIDLHVASEKTQLKYDFIVAAGMDASVIQLKVDGADGLSVKDGKLQIKTSVGTVEEMEPYAYQYVNDKKKVVRCRYKVKGDKVSFAFPIGYDESSPLIIDPTVVFASFTGSSFDNWGFTATYDKQGNFFSGGITSDVQGGTGYPTTPGAFQVVWGGGSSVTGSLYPCDMAISKFNAAGNALIYSTYLGGSDNDQPHSLIVDSHDNLIIAGRTYSVNFPVSNGFDMSYNGAADIVVSKLDSTGVALIGSTYMGGSDDDGVNFDAEEPIFGGLKHNYGDDARSEVLVDAAGDVYVAASTFSTNFPISSNAFQSAISGGQDGVVFKLNPGLNNLIYSTYLGGTSEDAAYVLALDPSQAHLYVAGGTSSTDFPSTTGTLWPSYQGGSADGFIVRFLNSGNYPLQKQTFIGRSDYDQCYGIQVDNNTDVYVMGQTLGGTFPVQPAGVYSNPNSSQFVMKLNSDLNNNIYSTMFGSGDPTSTNISPVAFLVDTCQNVYISGWGGALGFGFPGVGNTFGMPLSSNAAQSTTDGSDFYFIVLSTNIQSLLYATYMGENGGVGEHVDGGTSRFDKSGIVYQAICGGCGGSSAFPTTPGAWSQSNGSANCNLVALKIAFQLSIVKAEALTNNDTSGCPPLTVTFQNASLSAQTYLWDFGDGSPTTTAILPPPHTYNIPGTYTVKLIAFNPDACLKTSDTDFITIKVDSNSVNSDFTYKVIDSCGPYNVQFTNTSVYSHTPGSQTFTNFYWSFGDGTNFTGANPGVHNYTDTGTYTVSLVMTDTTACNFPDTMIKTVRVHGFPLKAAFNAPDSICFGGGLVFANASSNEQGITWYFGDGDTSNASSPGHQYLAPGTYTIMLVVTNPLACNPTDTAWKIIKIKALPEADFSFTPAIPTPNEPIQFHNLSVNATRYKWSFGDGTGSAEVDPSHLYKQTNSYTVCLEARNEDSCPDTVCKTVYADIHPAVDVPTAFSPNGDGQNDILYVRGAAIQKMDFKLFNRWGQLIFETTTLERGWDGTFNGKQQEMESYAYVLDVEFIDGSTVNKSGNVTLLR
jgi:gliding motility-associated-like protein